MIKMSNKALRTALLRGVNEYATYSHESSWARGAFDAYAAVEIGNMFED